MDPTDTAGRTWQHGWRVRTQNDRPRSGRPLGLRILVVEDDPDAAAALSLLLQVYGHQVSVAGTGPEAVAACHNTPPDVVLLDIGLPELDGWNVAKRLSERVSQKRPLIIAISGYGQEADRSRSAESGIDLHLVKPADPERLTGLLLRFQGLLRAGADDM